MNSEDKSIIPTRDVNKYYFYITEGGDIVLGFEKEKDHFFNKVIGNIEDIKGRYISLGDVVSMPLEEDEEVVKATFFDFIVGILKDF